MMKSSDIYQAPGAELRENTLEASKLASISKRFWAMVIDKVILVGLIVLGVWLVDSYEYYWNDPDTVFLYYMCIVGSLLLGINTYLLSMRGQTIGKRILKISIVNYEDGGRVNFLSLIFFRYILFWFGNAILGVLWLIDASFIFGHERRCLHDLAANTKVIDLQNNL
ncbi:RDD family protein [Zooshikella harenae]|uniref:RDD family protein n=1 Tax=Zooshikella harenae TaxID=2827238 RepID=A0ABS5ZLP2_9GAMM|nr:RDD family protein [Zooshikella harenae]MBU2714117.1 RDD family protein [Zooshikella harenae]